MHLSSKGRFTSYVDWLETDFESAKTITDHRHALKPPLFAPHQNTPHPF